MGDYRQTCNIRAGPVDKSIDLWDDCMRHIEDQACYSLLEEDCEYNGELLFEVTKGDVTNAPTCASWCQDFFPDCKYWIFNRKEDLCILKRDGRKTCKGWGGPKEPSFDHCQNLTISGHEL